MLSMLVLALLSVFYGAFTYYAYLQSRYLALPSFILAFLLVFPIVRLMVKPKEWVGYLMLFLSFAFFFSGAYIYPVLSIPFPSMNEIGEWMRGPLLGI